MPGGLIFYYFPTKQALLAAVLSERNILVELRTVGETLTVPVPRVALIALAFDPLHFVENMVDILLCRLVKIV